MAHQHHFGQAEPRAHHPQSRPDTNGQPASTINDAGGAESRHDARGDLMRAGFIRNNGRPTPVAGSAETVLRALRRGETPSERRIEAGQSGR